MPHLCPLTTVPSISGREASKEELMAPEHLVAIANAGEWNEHRRNTTLPLALPSKSMHSVLMLWLFFVFEGGKGDIYAVGL